MIRRGVLLLFLLVAAVCSVTCAPQDNSPKDGENTLRDKGKDKDKKAPLANIDVPKGLKNRIEAALQSVRQRDLLISHSFWTIFHGILGMGFDTMLFDPDKGSRVNAIEHIRGGGELRGLRFLLTPDGLDVQIGPQFVGQGHQDQFVSEMTQWGMTADKTFKISGKDYPFLDFANHSKARASVKDTPPQELSWAIMIIAEFFGTDLAWTNNKGENLHYDDVVRYELGQPIDGAACGGTHRLFGMTWSLHRHVQKGGAITPLWQEVVDHIEKYKSIARKTRNPDGSFSTDYFKGPGNAKDAQLRIGTTGHIVEWLALALNDNELSAHWMQEAVSALSLMILESKAEPVDGGSLYHAAHGLAIYHARVFGDKTGKGPVIPPPPK